jgi:hypothetical protein
MSKDDELRYGAPRNAVHISVDRPRKVPHQLFFNRPSMWFGIEPFLGDASPFPVSFGTKI